MMEISQSCQSHNPENPDSDNLRKQVSVSLSNCGGGTSESGFAGFTDYQDWSRSVMEISQSCQSHNPENPDSDNLRKRVRVSLSNCGGGTSESGFAGFTDYQDWSRSMMEISQSCQIMKSRKS